MIKKIFFSLLLFSLNFLDANNDTVNEIQNPVSIIELTKINFEQIVNESNKPLVIDIFADWCQPCNQMAPIYQEVAKQMQDTCLFAKADLMQLKDEEFFKSYNVQAIPTILVINNKELIGKIVGLMDLNNFRKRIDEILNPVDFDTLSESELMAKLCTILQQADIEGLKKVIATKKIDLNAPIINQGIFSGHYLLTIAYNYSSNLGDLGINIINVLLEAGASPDIEVEFPGITGKRSLCQLICQTSNQIEKMYENSKRAVELIKKYSKE